MKFIHIVIGSGDPRSINGVNRVVHSVATEQTFQGMSAEVWTINRNASPSDHQRNYVLQNFGMSCFRIGLSEDLKVALKRLKPSDWVQLHSVYIPEFTSIAKMLVERGVRYGFTPHGGYLSLQFDGSIKKLAKTLFATRENWALRHASFVQIIGDTELLDLRKRVPGVAIERIPNGFNYDQLSALDIQPLANNSFVYAGRLVIMQKGLDLLIEGFALYRRNGGKLNLRLIGNGKDRDELIKLVEGRAITESVEFIRGLSGKDFLNKLAGGVAFIHTSRYDVMPTACIEAAALGMPLLLTRETNLTEIFADGCWITSTDPQDIADRMFTVEKTSAQERACRGINARDTVKRDLTWRRIVQLLTQAVTRAQSQDQ